MKIRMLLFLCCLNSSFLFAQNTNDTKNPNRIYQFNNQNIDKAEITQTFGSLFKMKESDDLRILKSETNNGITHEKYQQYYSGLKVEDGIVIAHYRNRKLTSINGEYHAIGNAVVLGNFIGEDIALKSALGKSGNFKLNRSAGTENESGKGELVIFTKSVANKTMSFPAYKFDISSQNPVSRNLVFIDAHSGELLGKKSLLYFSEPNGKADTKYSGQVTFTTEKLAVAPKFTLKDFSRGGGILTYNLNKSQNDADTTLFIDDDNNWTSAEHHNIGMDDAALDVHWGMQVTYDFWNDVHDWKGWNGKGIKVKNFVHWGNGSSQAFFVDGNIYYGDGGFFNDTPWTDLDVVAHEFGHGINYGTSNLNYDGEGGSLHEGLSDIWATCVTDYANKKFGFKKDLTKIFEEHGTNYRQMNFPETYRGSNWVWGNEGGFHINGGVIRYWFYLVAFGGSGVNDDGFEYNISNPVGIEKAQLILFNAMKNYATPNTNYSGMRAVTALAAKDIDPEYEKVTEAAWDAVGVPSNLPEYCNVSSSDSKSFWIDGIEMGSFTSSDNQWAPESGYHFVSQPEIFIKPDQDYKFIVHFSNNNSTKLWKVWIDLNRDGQFNNSDELVTETKTENETDTSKFTIPKDLTSGYLRLRIMASTSEFQDACSNLTDGEIEDYAVYLVPNSAYMNKLGYSHPFAINSDNEIIGFVKMGSSFPGYGFLPKLGYSLLGTTRLNAWRGETYNTILKPRFLIGGNKPNQEYYSIWIDFNQDKIFSQSELVAQENTSDSTSTSISIPNDALIGDTYMRISMKRDSYAEDANESFPFGEVVDAPVTIYGDSSYSKDGYRIPRSNCTVAEQNPYSPYRFLFDSLKVGNAELTVPNFINDENLGYIDYTKKENLSEFNSLGLKEVKPDTVLNLLLKPRLKGNSAYYYKVWIDFNGNKKFTDKGELVFSDSSSGAIKTVIKSRLLQGLDNTRIRVSISYIFPHFNPDTEVFFGQIIDLLYGKQTGVYVSEDQIKPAEFELYPVYPNPFNPETNIRFFVPEKQNVSVEIFSLLGQKVMTLENKVFEKGEHETKWKADKFSSGFYLVRIQSGNKIRTQKALLLK